MRACQNVLFTIVALLLTAPLFAQTAESVQERGDASSLDLGTGPGGRAAEPGTDCRFLKESPSGTSPKFDVEDEHGIR